MIVNDELWWLWKDTSWSLLRQCPCACLHGQGTVVTVLHYAPRYQDVWVSGGTAPHILNLGTRRRKSASFTCRFLYSRHQLHRKLGGPTPGLDAVTKRKYRSGRESNLGCHKCETVILGYSWQLTPLNWNSPRDATLTPILSIHSLTLWSRSSSK
jgi:hypothetical protein